jgi:hypothetical protein
VDHDRLAEVGRQLELGSEQTLLPIVRRPVAVEVEPGFADGDGALLLEQLGQLGEPLGLGTARLMWVDTERRENPGLGRRDLERGAAGIDAGADRDHAVDAGLARAGEQHLGQLLAPVEVRVGVDHATAVSSSTRGKSGSAGSIPSAATVQP